MLLRGEVQGRRRRDMRVLGERVEVVKVLLPDRLV